MASGKSGKGRRENTKMRWNVKTAIIALLKRTLLFIFIYTHSFMQFMVLALQSPNRVNLKQGESNDKRNLSQQKSSSSVRITAQIVVLHYNSGGYSVPNLSVVGRCLSQFKSRATVGGKERRMSWKVISCQSG